MGTRIEDQPPEHWAGPESLDPTPVWKQFALIGIFLFLGLVLLGGVAVFAAAPQLVTPPALVPVKCPFACHFFEPSQQKLAEPVGLFDLAEDRFDNRFARRIHRLAHFRL